MPDGREKSSSVPPPGASGGHEGGTGRATETSADDVARTTSPVRSRGSSVVHRRLAEPAAITRRWSSRLRQACPS